MLTNADINYREPTERQLAPDLYCDNIYNDSPRLPGSSTDVNLASVDLNLLVALEALLRHRNVTHAGKRVGLSQPAMSRALSRLRALFDDELLVRTARGLTLTLRAEQLLAKLPEALILIRQLISGRSLATTIRPEIHVAMPEHQSVVLLPRLLPRLLQQEPHLDINLRTDLCHAARGLEEGSIDLAIGQMNDAPSGFYSRTLYSDRLACLVRRGHPVLSGPWSMKEVLKLRHAIISCREGLDSTGITDVVPNFGSKLEPLIIPNLTVATVMLEQTDLALILPLRAALATLTPSLLVKQMPEEFQPQVASLSLIWHERCHRDEHHRWIRTQFAAAAMQTT